MEPKAKGLAEGETSGRKFEKSAILFEKNLILKDILPIMSHLFKTLVFPYCVKIALKVVKQSLIFNTVSLMIELK